MNWRDKTRLRQGFGGQGKEVVNMPGFDGTGPQGMGPTGGRRGNCGAGFGRGYFGRGLRSFGRRFLGRDRFNQDARSEKEILNEEEKALEGELKAVRKEKERFNNSK